jgi:hypothetical protein
MTKESIYIPKEAYFKLNQRGRAERGCKPLSEDAQERMWSRIPEQRKKGDMIRVDKDSLGGGDGTYYGKWTSWDVPTLKRMVEELGFSWEEGEVIEYIPI